MTQALSYRGHLKAILLLGLPLIGSQLAQFAVHMTDTIMLGWYSVESLAAAVLATGFAFILFILGSGFAFAVTPLVATADAQGDTTAIRRYTRMGLWIGLLYSAVVMTPMIFSEPIFLWMGQEPELAELAQRYLRISAPGMFMAISGTVIRSYLSALELTRPVLYASLWAVALNIVFNYLFIFGNFGAPELGIRGAAIASLAVNTMMFVYWAAYSLRKLPEHELFVRFWRPDWDAFKQVFRLGLPIGLTNLAEVGLFNFAAIMVGWLGAIPLAAHGIALQLGGAAFMVHLGLSAAATIRAGRALGNGDEEHLRRGAYMATGMSAALSFIAMAAFLLVPQFLIGLFIDPEDPLRPEIIAMGTGLLVYAAIFQLADSLQVMALGLLRGVQDARVPMWMAGISYWVFGAPASYICGFVFGWGAEGVWIGLVVGLSLAAVLLNLRFWKRSVKIHEYPPTKSVEAPPAV
ncbi:MULTISPECIES: MATE family efflux transporter [Halocynthiibacter]|uniref:Multidrug-efflux transporter n=1 Tax=Halocynthiibacter halioticoli TaxID=2986804 RepID=A0AAE3IXA6_9RHOB|nr:MULTISPECIES: MATE family efflux transporter [Halocynthiibacter]MCV6823803.1 MATE family efflux transporter [Halocynthiibacter halioticoli]MCW4056804.1 MATE family efflux transporter [Halocynthiibacter sp. SDUM655004]